jgi:hypothetical protein
VRITTFVLLGLLALVGYVVFKMNSGSSVRSAIAGPEVLASETVSLDEGQGREYSFALPTQRRVEVVVTATPKSVNVFLMNQEDFQSYTKARKKLLGGKFSYRQLISSEAVLSLHKTEMLPAGSWRIVVERPSESLLGSTAAATTVKVTAL